MGDGMGTARAACWLARNCTHVSLARSSPREDYPAVLIPNPMTPARAIAREYALIPPFPSLVIACRTGPRRREVVSKGARKLMIL